MIRALPRFNTKQIRWLLVASPMLINAACSRRAAEGIVTGNHFDVRRDVPYDSGPRQRLDVYRPKKAGPDVPVIVFIHGGTWQRGSKEEYQLVGDAVTRRGLVAVVVSYRVYPSVIFPAWVDDAARAVRWVSDSIRAYGGDPRKIFVVGHSAGGHTAALLAVDSSYLLKVGLQPDAVRGYVSIAAPLDNVWTDPVEQALMGPREGWPATNPTQLVNARVNAPFLLLHGDVDETVPVAKSLSFGARVRQHGGCVRTIVYRKLGHAGIVVALSLSRFGIAPVLDDVIAFIEQPEAFA
ncbi:MAG: alpha/beta hydrolase, partial [Gemmatimonadaceae bacterium]